MCREGDVELSKLIKCKETAVVTDILIINPSNILLFVQSCAENIAVDTVDDIK